MSVQVGFVSSVQGTNIIIQMDEDCNKILYRYNGELYHGVAIREYLSIKTGIYDIVCRVEGEYLDEKYFQINAQEEKEYIRRVQVKPIGYIENEEFKEGARHLPMIMDNAYLMTDKELSSIYNNPNIKYAYLIGKTLTDDVPFSVNFNVLFNKHIGVFGNTGSGKSNTLTKLYTNLFIKFKDKIKDKSYFVLFDFNGEYTGKQILDDQRNKNVIKLSTRNSEIQSDRIEIEEDCFWDEDILGLMFKATYNTQRPFLKNLVQGRKKYHDKDSLSNYYNVTVHNFAESTNQKKEIKELFLSIVALIDDCLESDFPESAKSTLENLHWHSQQNSYYFKRGNETSYFNEDRFKSWFKDELSCTVDLNQLLFVDELLVRAYLQLINGLLKGAVQFDHIHPLINRIKALKNNIQNVIKLRDDNRETNESVVGTNPLLQVISFRKCNQDIKKVLPLIIAKSFYENHKQYSEGGEIKKTLHFIIDEAHNILSYESTREEESWKDYRLELFEEIIKEGRKFGVFMTISSQRPADISQTIMSQFHNFFIHRLVNDRDLALLDNAISSLDKVSKSQIPILPTGACIVTGTSFVVPFIIQIDRIDDIEFRPDSDDVELVKLWELDV